jgi:hypothetical protein
MMACRDELAQDAHNRTGETMKPASMEVHLQRPAEAESAASLIERRAKLHSMVEPEATEYRHQPFKGKWKMNIIKTLEGNDGATSDI